MKDDLTQILIGLSMMLFLYLGFLSITKKTTPPKEKAVTIVTCKDIYYVYEDSIVTETGKKITDFKKAYIEAQTTLDVID